MKWIWLVILSAISGILYRLGGWIQTKIRDFGCALITLLSYFIFGLWCKNQLVNIIAYLLCFGALFGALTTYWDFLFGYDNFYMHGFMIGIASFPLIAIGVVWWDILIRAVVLGLSMGLINKYVNKWGWKHSDWIEECSRGCLIILTIPIL